MEMMEVVKWLITVPILYLTFYSLYWLGTTLLGLMYRPKKPDLINILMGLMTFSEKPEEENSNNPELLLILPAYKPGLIFLKVLNSIQHAIQGRNIHVYILLQEAERGFREKIQHPNFIIEEQQFSHLPGNSYHHALHHIVGKIKLWNKAKIMNPDFVMLVDKDNLLAPDFFQFVKLQDYQNYDVIQAKRSGINADGHVSFFDTVSEGLNDTMFRAAKRFTRGTIEISGSGALIRTPVFLDTIERLDSKAPGYDKNFMVQILSSKFYVKTTYLPYVELFEEKTSDQENYNPQRLRWFGEQYYNALYSAKKLILATLKYRRFAAFEYLLVLWRPPRSIQILLVPVLGAIETITYVLQGYWWLGFPYMGLSTCMLGMAAFLFLVKEKLLKSSLNHMMSLPKLAYHNIHNAKSSIKKENHGKFIHTEHKL